MLRKKFIKPERVMVHYECCRCGNPQSMLVKEITSSAFLCNECNKMENYMEIVGVSIKPERKSL